MSRGKIWFEALAGAIPAGDPASVLCADGTVGDERSRFLAVVPNPEARFPRAQSGELGLEEGWALARRVREVVAADDDRGDRRALVAHHGGEHGQAVEVQRRDVDADGVQPALDEARRRPDAVGRRCVVGDQPLGQGPLVHGSEKG